jgi:hypothetical protein
MRRGLVGTRRCGRALPLGQLDWKRSAEDNSVQREKKQRKQKKKKKAEN